MTPAGPAHPASASAIIREMARDLSIDAIGIAPPTLDPIERRRFGAFLDAGYHGDMTWLAEREAGRTSPQVLWPATRAIVMCAMNYGPASDPLADLDDRRRAVTSVYARGRDYHDVFKARLKQLARAMIDRLGGEVKVFVDTAPVMEKPLAEAAGLGWRGKHTNLVSRDFGSWLFLGAIFTSLPLVPDAPERDHCGGCSRCLDICPTKAFPGPYQLDARRCIAYLTIEHKGHIPGEFRAAIGNRVFGCDDCLAVCPWNKFASEAADAKLRARTTAAPTSLTALAELDDAEFRRIFAGSPIKRTGRDRFVRNVMIAIGNSADHGLLASAIARLTDTSSLVRLAAVWAVRQLATPDIYLALRAAHEPGESDPDVQSEWRDSSPPAAP